MKPKKKTSKIGKENKSIHSEDRTADLGQISAGFQR